jgi:hypothetical protein
MSKYDLTFGVVTQWEDPTRIYHMVDTINREMTPSALEYEVLICGEHPSGDQFQYFHDQQIHWAPRFQHCNGWITHKKNKIAEYARGEIIVMMHDYFILQPGWSWGYKIFGFDWDICNNPQQLLDGRRHFTDWVNWDDPEFPKYHSFGYDDWSHTKHQYISGGYFLVKKQVLLDNPFDESMKPGSPEDVEWSLRVRDKYKIVCNRYSTVRHNKMHRDL